MQLSQKESSLLKELKEQEKLCAERYDKHSRQAHDEQLKTLFSQLADTERKHLDTLTQIENGEVPEPPQQQPQQEQHFSQTYGFADTPEKNDDYFLCSDLLGAEKFASNLYNTGVFEFRDMKARQMLSHIQSEEQQHGKKLYDYMAANGMYQVS